MSRFVYSVIFLLIFFVPDSKAQHRVNYAVHANIVYRFTKYVNWPDDRKSGDFIIGIVGNSPLYNELKRFVANKQVGKQNLVLRQFSSSSSTFNCHILFISDDARKSFGKIVSTTLGEPILLVSENSGLSRKGSCINFNLSNERLQLEINKENILGRDLQIASELLSLGVIVE
jgi:hypothetical protein